MAHKKHEEPEHPRSHHKAHKAAEERPRFSFEVGSRVTYKGQDAEIVAVTTHDDAWFAAGLEQQYCVRVPAAPGQDHKFDTFGCVPESEIS